MRLVAFGCSHTSGEGITEEDASFTGAKIHYSKHSWAENLSNMLGTTLVNTAQPGLSNRAILDRLVRFDFEPTDIVAIAWTYPIRYTLFKSHIYNHEHDLNINASKVEPGKHLRKHEAEINKCRRNFYNLFDDYNIILANVMQINHGYLFCDARKLNAMHNFVLIQPEMIDIANEINISHTIEHKLREPSTTHIAECIMPNKGADNQHYNATVHKEWALNFYNNL